MSRADPRFAGLEYLLDLHKETYEIGGGWWVTIRATRVEISGKRPHGLQYSLTLHNPKGDRVLGYDNAHSWDEAKISGRMAKKEKTYDHVHRRGRRRGYTFVSPVELLEDFWRDVEAILKEEGVQ